MFRNHSVSEQPPHLEQASENSQDSVHATHRGHHAKDDETPRYTTQRTHRTYSAEFKAQLVAAYQQPGVSVAALAQRHAMNANELHRWLKEHRLLGCHQTEAASDVVTASSNPSPPPLLFISVQMQAPMPLQATEQTPPVIQVTLCKGDLSMQITWPVSAAKALARWTAALVQ